MGWGTGAPISMLTFFPLLIFPWVQLLDLALNLKTLLINKPQFTPQKNVVAFFFKIFFIRFFEFLYKNLIIYQGFFINKKEGRGWGWPTL